MSAPSSPGFFDPRSLVTWTVVGLVGLGVYWQVTSTFDLWGDYPGGIALSAVVWLVYGVVVTWLVHRSQLFERRPGTATVAAVLWGLFVAGGVVAVAGEDLRSITDKVLGFDTSREWGPAFRAPLVEETMKYLGVVALALIPRVNLRRVVDGVYYGALSGLGFLVSENMFFSNEEITLAGGEGAAGEVAGVMVLRGIFALPFSHVVYTAIAGAGVGYVVSRRGRPLGGRLAVAFALYATAFLLHGFQNSPLLDDVGGNLFIKGLPALVMFLLVLRWGRREYRADLRALAAEIPEISDEDLAALATRRRRRKAVKAAANRDTARTVQKGQVDLLVTVDVHGRPSPQANEAGSRLASLLATQA